MNYRYRRYRRRLNRYSRSGSSSTSQRREVSRLYGGIDDDVRRMFFGLDRFTLMLVFNKYEKIHGSGKRKYAEATFYKWQSGSVQMSGTISDRLVRIVPTFFSFEQKYDLIEKLWSRFRQKSTLRITISPQGGLEAAVEAVLDAIDAIGEQDLPTAVTDRLEWLAAGDGVAAQALLAQVTRREAELAVQTLESELSQLIELARVHADKSVSSSRTVILPAATVYIHVAQALPAARRPGMNQDQTHPKDEGDGEVDRPKSDPRSRELAPIQNPSDLLGEALRRMTPEKQEEIVGKATDEALRLQVKQKEGQLDHDMAASKVDSVADAANRLGSAGTDFEVKAEHRSEHGRVEVTVRSRKPSLKDRVGGCFVATACYGDPLHPAVMALREFRDEWLRERPAGRVFIAWYYRTSPPLAKLIAGSAVLRCVGRFSLYPAIALARLVTRSRPSSPSYSDDHIPR